MKVLITGANRGLGLALSRRMAQEGHEIFMGVRASGQENAAALAEEYPDNITPVVMDVADEAQVKAAADWIRRRAGKLDAVVSNAGVLPDADRTLPVTAFDTDAFQYALSVNVLGAALVIKHFQDLVQDGGFFLNVTSEAGSMTNVGDKYPVYSITKSAQNKMTAIFAKTVSHYSVYAVHPGRMNTGMGRATAQIEPGEAADGFYAILTGQTKLPENWFINYLGEPMEI